MNSKYFVAAWCCVLVCLCGCSSSVEQASTKGQWYKGNLHTHSLWSDGDEFPERIVQWYRDHDYQFLGISDHNVLHQGEKWVKYSDVYLKGAGPATDAYLKEFKDLAKVRGEREKGTQQIR